MVTYGSFDNSTVLITGATGLLGYNLAIRLLSSKKVRVIVLSRNEEKIRRCYASYINGNNFSYYVQDISNGLGVVKEHVDYIFHAAGTIERKYIENMPLDVISPNVFGIIKCLQFLKCQKDATGQNGRLVYFSSEAVYGKREMDCSVRERDTDYADSIESPRAPYSESKRMAEVILKGFVKQVGVDAVIARFSWVYGNAVFRPSQALFDFIELALRGENIIIQNPDTPRRDNIFMSDAMEALLVVALYGKNGEAYNISSNGEKGNYAGSDEIAELIVRYVNERQYAKRTVKVMYEKDASVRSGGIKMDNEKIKELGWQLKTDLESGLHFLVEEIRKTMI